MANTLAYGFVGLDHLFAERVTDSNVRVVRDAIAQSVAEHNRQVNAISDELVVPTEEYSIRFKQPGSGTLQPLDDYGNPKPVREGGYYDVAFPIQGGGTAWGDNRVSRALMTVEEVNEMVLGSLRRDADWMRRHMLAALLDNTSWTFADPEHGNLTIQPLANGDTVSYIRRNGNSATDDHYYAQAAAIADANNPFPTLYSDLVEHPVNAGAEIVAYVASDLTTSIEGLAGFEPVGDPDVQLGSGSNVLTGSTAAGFGEEVLGKVDKVWVVEYGLMPSGYGLVVARGSGAKVLAQREYPAPELKGLFSEENSPDGNLREHRLIRYAGFGVQNRVGAMAFYIGGASYVIPTAYVTPLAV